ncbi:hypothetical protein IW261DRAFT_1416610 [Armillaria novae-zelandiae]|uniref:Uncharacterized protein n=1 Tax=Armillaria novae-zelandiae TaxID=153914 RepID=A0AA39PI53_9AGAR|nr:hypothetical protein IW261DRAFT_1416610 [Armillaria novae-zelandiae]
MWRMLKIALHGPPEPLEANTESESEEMAAPAAGPKASETSPPSGGVSSSDKEGEQEVEQSAQVTVAEEGLVSEKNGAGVGETPRSPTPPGLDAGSSGSVTPLVGRKCIAPASPIPPVTTGEDARESPFKKVMAKGSILAKGFTKTGWPLALNQQLREGRTQPAMHANMEVMQEDGVLLAALTKCDRCKATSGRSCRILADLDNGRPSCAECLISSHSCPSHLAPATQAAHPATIRKAPTVHRQVVVTVPHIGDVAQEYRRIEGSQMNPHPPVGGDFTTDFAFGLVERLGLRSHPRKATWDRIVATSGQIVAGYHALQYELQNYRPFDEADIERLLTNRFPESRKLRSPRVPLRRRTFLDGRPDFLGEQIPSPVITDGERVALWVLIGRHGGSPSWVEHLGGHDIRTTLNILNLGSHSIKVKEEEVDELIVQGLIVSWGEQKFSDSWQKALSMDKMEQREVDTGAYPSNTQPTDAQPPQGGNDNPRPWENFGCMGKLYRQGCWRWPISMSVLVCRNTIIVQECRGSKSQETSKSPGDKQKSSGTNKSPRGQTSPGTNKPSGSPGRDRPR